MTTPLSAILKEMGIRQDGDPVLRRIAEPFDLPAEAEQACEIEARLLSYVPRLKAIYPFTKGVGIAAPQIGFSRAIAIVKPPDSGEHITLVNPEVVWASPDTDCKAEGCLSFFDVRGEVPRPLAMDVQTTQLDGTTKVIRLERGWARLAMHEIDHLYGVLYKDHISAGESLVPTENSRDGSQDWDYK
jgi:peptide deformylase